MFLNIHFISKLLFLLFCSATVCINQHNLPFVNLIGLSLVWSIVAEPSLHLYLSYYFCTSNTFISIIFQKRPLKRDKTSFVLRKLSWEPILDRYCTTVIPILFISNIFLTKSWASSHLSTVCGWFVQFDSTTTTYNNSKDNTSAGESLLLSSNFRAFQIVSDTFKYSQMFSSRSAEQIQAVKCCLARVNNDSFKFQSGASCSKWPDREMLTSGNTTPRCNPHLEDKLTVEKPACGI